MKLRLIEQERKPRWTGSKALVVLPTGECPVDGSPLVAHEQTEMALLRHGGYGADRRTIAETCEQCGWSITREVSEANPNKRSA